MAQVTIPYHDLARVPFRRDPGVVTLLKLFGVTWLDEMAPFEVSISPIDKSLTVIQTERS